MTKLAVSIDFWTKKGGCLSEEVIAKLRKADVPFELGEFTNYKTTKTPVRMNYLDDIDIPEFREIPTYKRLCNRIMKNDHACKYMGFALTKKEKESIKAVLEKYKVIDE